MAACYPTATSKDAGSSEKRASVATLTFEPNTAGADLTTTPRQDDVKISREKLEAAPEPSTVAPTAQSPTAASPAPPMKQKGPGLLKPQHETALKDFIVSIPSPSYKDSPQLTLFQRIFSFSTWLDKAMLLAAVLASIGAGVTMPVMNIIFGTKPPFITFSRGLEPG